MSLLQKILTKIEHDAELASANAIGAQSTIDFADALIEALNIEVASAICPSSEDVTIYTNQTDAELVDSAAIKNIIIKSAVPRADGRRTELTFAAFPGVYIWAYRSSTMRAAA